MADAVFDVFGKFGEGLVVTVGDEQWIVAEAAGGRVGRGNRSFANAFGDINTCPFGSAIATTATKRARRSVLRFGEFREK